MNICSKDDSKNYHAMVEIEGLQVGNLTIAQADAGFRRIFKKYNAHERVIKVFKNGLAKIGVYDKDGKYITEYTDAPKNVGQYTR